MNKNEYLDKSSYIMASSYRSKILKSLYGEEIYKTPTQLAKDTGIKRNHISNVLVDLKKTKYVECVNENRRKNRLYCLTQFGKDIYNFIGEIGD